MIDFRRLLILYLEHVTYSEGTDFLYGSCDLGEMSKDEIDALRDARNEARKKSGWAPEAA